MGSSCSQNGRMLIHIIMSEVISWFEIIVSNPKNSGFDSLSDRGFRFLSIIFVSLDNAFKYHVSCTDGKISVRINLLFYLNFPMDGTTVEN